MLILRAGAAIAMVSPFDKAGGVLIFKLLVNFAKIFFYILMIMEIKNKQFKRYTVTSALPYAHQAMHPGFRF
jgi:hypothetical protein